MNKKPKGLKKSKSLSVSLPENRTIVSDDLSDYIWLIYGDRKIGKTTLLSEFPDVFFLMFDPLNKGLAIYQSHVSNWAQFLKFITLLEKNPDYCKLLVIDTGYMCYEMCFAYVCKKHNVTDPRDKGWAVVWKDIAKEFMEAHERILNIGIGLAVTAHSEVKEITRRDGTSYNKLSTQLGGSAFKYYNGLVDVIAYYSYNQKGKRELVVQGDSLIEAGSRIQDHFKFTNGEPVDVIPMGKTQGEAFKNLKDAFDNKLKQPVKGEKKKKKKGK